VAVDGAVPGRAAAGVVATGIWEPESPAERPARRALARAREHLLGLQHPEGWWKGVLDTNVTMDAEDLLLREILGVLTEEVSRPAAAWIRSQQRPDGSWATFFGGPGDLSTTVEAYVALRVAGERAGEPHMEAAARFVRERGGLSGTRVFTRIWLAMVGLWPWEELPAIPPEVVLLPPWVPLNVYDFACWARQTVVAVTVVAAHRPVHRLPFGVSELEGEGRTASWPGGGSATRPSRTGRALLALDRLLRAYERRPIRSLRRSALARAEAWIVERQEADGSWGGIQPPWVYSLLALRLLGYELDHPVMAAGLSGIEGFVVHEGGTRRLEACQSPVWDTALAVTALRDAGVSAAHPSLRRAVDWLVAQEVRVKGDWAVRRPALPPGGWAFEFSNVHYPDIDDTAIVVLALLACGVPASENAGQAAGAGDAAGALERGVRWVLGMRSRDGGWGAFDADNDRRACRELPFCDFGEVIDPPSADVTAHVVEMLAACGRRDDPVTRQGVEWLWAAQEADGAWFGRWGVNYVYGTGAALTALAAVGTARSDQRLRRAGRWLVAHQNPDGGWGEDLRSYTDPAWRGRGTSTASQTAWALLGLLALEEGGDGGGYAGAIERGVGFLAGSQREDGTWEEPWYTGTGFPGDFSINYHLYRLVFPVMALGRYCRRPTGQAPAEEEVPA
jgi:squalene-hopene/tetraprenyl-beta-curcumene cyclase